MVESPELFAYIYFLSIVSYLFVGAEKHLNVGNFLKALFIYSFYIIYYIAQTGCSEATVIICFLIIEQ